MIEYKGYNYEKQGEKYVIYNEKGKEWIVDIPTEEDAKKQIDDLVIQKTQNPINIEERVSALEDIINMQLGF